MPAGKSSTKLGEARRHNSCQRPLQQHALSVFFSINSRQNGVAFLIYLRIRGKSDPIHSQHSLGRSVIWNAHLFFLLGAIVKVFICSVDNAVDATGRITCRFRYPRLGAFEVFLRIPSINRRIVGKHITPDVLASSFAGCRRSNIWQFRKRSVSQDKRKQNVSAAESFPEVQLHFTAANLL